MSIVRSRLIMLKGSEHVAGRAVGPQGGGWHARWMDGWKHEEGKVLDKLSKATDEQTALR